MQKIIGPLESVELLTRAPRVLKNCGGMVSSYAEMDFKDCASLLQDISDGIHDVEIQAPT